MFFFTKDLIEKYFDYSEFVDFLSSFLRSDVTVPQRSHLSLSTSDTMLIMPCWSEVDYMGVKLVNVFPKNIELPSINGIYSLFSKGNGQLLAQFDGLSITTRRTAAISVLAARYLDVHPKYYTILGTGNLSPQYVKAFSECFENLSIKVWGRNMHNAESQVEMLRNQGYDVKICTDLESDISKSDLVSTLTLAQNPILKGSWISSGTHIDLVGSYLPESRELDDDGIINKRILVDTDTAFEESGDLKIPMNDGLIDGSNLLGNLKDFQFDEFKRLPHEITIFKSVGMANSDLAIAVFLYNKWQNDESTK